MRLSVIDKENQVLADVGCIDYPLNVGIIQSIASGKVLLVLDKLYSHAIIVRPYSFKGRRVATIVAELNLKAIFNDFIRAEESVDDLYRMFYTDNSKDVYEINGSYTAGTRAFKVIN